MLLPEKERQQITKDSACALRDYLQARAAPGLLLRHQPPVELPSIVHRAPVRCGQSSSGCVPYPAPLSASVRMAAADWWKFGPPWWLPPGEAGRSCAKIRITAGPQVAAEYWGPPEKYRAPDWADP